MTSNLQDSTVFCNYKSNQLYKDIDFNVDSRTIQVTWNNIRRQSVHMQFTGILKDLYACPIENIKGLTEKGQLQYLTRLNGPQDGTYLYTAQFLSPR